MRSSLFAFCFLIYKNSFVVYWREPGYINTYHQNIITHLSFQVRFHINNYYHYMSCTPYKVYMYIPAVEIANVDVWIGTQSLLQPIHHLLARRVLILQGT